MPFWVLPTIVTAVWGANTVLIKLLAEQLPPLHLATYRMVLATLFILPFWWTVRHRPEITRSERKRTMSLAAWAGVSIVLLHQVFLALGMQWSKASIGSLILGLNPIMTSLLASRFAGEPITWRRLFGALVGFAGVSLAVLDDRWHTAATLRLGLGEVAMFAAMGVYVIGSLLVRQAAGREPATLFTIRMNVIGTGLLVLLVGLDAIVQRQPLPTVSAPHWWGVIFLSGAVSNGLCGMMWNHSVQKWGVARVSMFLNGLPVTTLMLSAWWLDESIRWPQWVGLVTVILGIWQGTRSTPTEKGVMTLSRPA